MSAEKV